MRIPLWPLSVNILPKGMNPLSCTFLYRRYISQIKYLFTGMPVDRWQCYDNGIPLPFILWLILFTNVYSKISQFPICRGLHLLSPVCYIHEFYFFICTTPLPGRNKKKSSYCYCQPWQKPQLYFYVCKDVEYIYVSVHVYTLRYDSWFFILIFL